MQGRSSGFAKCFFSPASRALPPTLPAAAYTVVTLRCYEGYAVTTTPPPNYVRAICSRLVMFDHTVVNQQPPERTMRDGWWLPGGSRKTLFHWVPLYQLTMVVNSNSRVNSNPLALTCRLIIHIHLHKVQFTLADNSNDKFSFYKPTSH
jgi:hypothetical protein